MTPIDWISTSRSGLAKSLAVINMLAGNLLLKNSPRIRTNSSPSDWLRIITVMDTRFSSVPPARFSAASMLRNACRGLAGEIGNLVSIRCARAAHPGEPHDASAFGDDAGAV